MFALPRWSPMAERIWGFGVGSDGFTEIGLEPMHFGDANESPGYVISVAEVGIHLEGFGGEPDGLFVLALEPIDFRETP